MQMIASYLVHKPVTILAVALVFIVGYVVLRSTSLGEGRHPGALLVPIAGWLLYAGWEWLVMTRTPDANIRFDLLLIWPVLMIVSVWFSIRALR